MAIAPMVNWGARGRKAVRHSDVLAGDSMPTRGALVSNIKCNSHGPQGIGCCDGQRVQAPRRRGTWRDFGLASARGEPAGDRRSSGSCARHDQSGTVAWPLRCTARASPIARSSAGQRIGRAAGIADSGASWRRKLAAQAGPRRLAAGLCAGQVDPPALVAYADCAQAQGHAPR